jgi:hypothetical protein
MANETRRKMEIVDYAGDRGMAEGYRVEIDVGGVRFVDQDGGLFDTREGAEARRSEILRGELASAESGRVTV